MTDKGILGNLVLDTAQRRQLELVERTYQQEMDALEDNDTLSDIAAKAQADQLARAPRAVQACAHSGTVCRAGPHARGGGGAERVAGRPRAAHAGRSWKSERYQKRKLPRHLERPFQRGVGAPGEGPVTVPSSVTVLFTPA